MNTENLQGNNASTGNSTASVAAPASEAAASGNSSSDQNRTETVNSPQGQNNGGESNNSASANLGDSANPPPPLPVLGSGGDQLKVNTQIVDAVRQTRDAVRIGSDDTSKIIDSGIAYQKASQAAAFAVQDATDYLRNIMTISSTAQGMALKLFLETKDPTYSEIIIAAQAAVTSAATNLATVGASATSVAQEFPR